VVHALAEHTWPAAHARPHAPQLLPSIVVSTHAAPHRVCPAGQPGPQRPSAQLGLAPAHAAPHIPQLRTSVCRLTSQPFAALPSQFAKPVLHTIPQDPPLHEGVAFGAAGHAPPQRPQCATVFVTLVSHPFARFPSQLPKLATHAMSQRLATHVAAPFAPPAQRLLHAPQCSIAVRGSTHAGSPPGGVQVVLGASHVNVHRPPLQTKPTPQAFPQVPQSVALVFVSMHASPQRVWPAGHTHAPPEHEVPMAQTFPQVPQLRLVVLSVQLAPQAIVPGGHMGPASTTTVTSRLASGAASVPGAALSRAASGVVDPLSTTASIPWTSVGISITSSAGALSAASRRVVSVGMGSGGEQAPASESATSGIKRCEANRLRITVECTASPLRRANRAHRAATAGQRSSTVIPASRCAIS
jgi:hypothetical protein